jgi:hypothetical protein
MYASQSSTVCKWVGKVISLYCRKSALHSEEFEYYIFNSKLLSISLGLRVKTLTNP